MSRSLVGSSVLSVMLLAGLAACATTTDRTAHDGRAGSIKDDPVDVAPIATRSRAGATVMPISTTAQPSRPSTKKAAGHSVVVQPPVVQEAPRSSAARVEPAPILPKPVDSQPLAQPKSKDLASVVTTPEPNPPVERPQAKPADVPSAAPAGVPTTPALPQVDTKQSAATVAAPPAGSLPAPMPSTSQPARANDAKSDGVSAAVVPKVVPLTDEQRIASTLQRVDTYMRANKYQDARTLLEDAAKSGDPRLLSALAELYDPTYLREAFPRLARTGDPEKAIALYEQARKAGAKGLDQRIEGLKILAGGKR